MLGPRVPGDRLPAAEPGPGRCSAEYTSSHPAGVSIGTRFGVPWMTSSKAASSRSV
jgi:hypothetical protein